MGTRHVLTLRAGRPSPVHHTRAQTLLGRNSTTRVPTRRPITRFPGARWPRYQYLLLTNGGLLQWPRGLPVPISLRQQTGARGGQGRQCEQPPPAMDRWATVGRARASRNQASLHSTASLLPRHSRSSPPIVHPARGTLLEALAIVV